MTEPWKPGQLTVAESVTLSGIKGFMSAYKKLPLGHPHEEVEVELHIHALQRLIMMRPVLRAYPERFTMTDKFRETYGLPPEDGLPYEGKP
jgi:hypothetical protein